MKREEGKEKEKELKGKEKSEAEVNPEQPMHVDVKGKHTFTVSGRL
jgi:hypothetical protein